MNTIPEPIQNCNHRLQNCHDTQILNPSNSTDSENRQGSTAYPDAKTMDSETLFNCFRSAETILHTTCAESVGFSVRVLFANRSRNGKYGQFKHWRSKMNNMLIAVCKKQNPQPLVGESDGSKKLQIVVAKLPEARFEKFFSPEVIAERLSLCAISPISLIDKGQPEAKQ